MPANNDNIVILHGWGASSKSWIQVKQLLERKGYKVLVFDLPGFGNAGLPPQPFSVGDYVDWVKKEVKNFGPFFLLGHSFGGRVSIKFAAKYPGKLKGLILVSSAGIKHKPLFLLGFILKIFKRFKFISNLPILKNIFYFFRQIFYKYILRKTDYLNVSGVMKGTFKKAVEEDLSPYLPKIKVPTLIIWGEKDKITPLKDAYLMKKEIRNSKLEIIKNAGHAPHLYNPDEVAEMAAKFIRPVV